MELIANILHTRAVGGTARDASVVLALLQSPPAGAQRQGKAAKPGQTERQPGQSADRRAQRAQSAEGIRRRMAKWRNSRSPGGPIPPPSRHPQH